MSPRGFCYWNKEQNLFHECERLFQIIKNPKGASLFVVGFFSLTTGISWRQTTLPHANKLPRKHLRFVCILAMCVNFLVIHNKLRILFFNLYESIILRIVQSPTTTYLLSTRFYTAFTHF